MKTFKTLWECTEYVQQEKLYLENVKIHIVYDAKNWEEEYSEQSRTYASSTAFTHFHPCKMGSCLGGDCLDGTDSDLRLDVYKWKIKRVELFI